MYSKKRGFWGWLKGDRRTRLQRETLGRDTLEIKYMYMLEGFLGVQVQESFAVLGKDSTALIDVRIDEGMQFVYGKKTITGEHDPTLDFYLNKTLADLKEGEPINYFEVRAASFEMKTVLANSGYPYATVVSRVDTVANQSIAPIGFIINADSLVRYGDVDITGTHHFPTYTASRELKIKKDSIYRRNDILESQRRLLESGYFSTFQLNQADSTVNRYQPDFLLNVRERKPLYVSFETGALQSEERDLEWEFFTAFGKRNFLRSRRLELSADYSFSVGGDSRLLRNRYRLKLSDPWPLGFRMPLSLSIDANPRIKDATQDFDKASWGVTVSTTKRYGRKLRINLGLVYESVDISGVSEDEILLIKLQEGNSARRKLYLNVRRDSRDDLFVPSYGSVTEFSSEFFGGFLGGDENFFKIETSWSRYQILWPGWISATRIKAGWTDAFGASEFIPSDELLFLGGANTVRGFRENTLGPLLPDGDPKGARIIAVLNQEFRWKTIQVLRVLPFVGGFFKALPLWQTVFFDAGNGFDRRHEIKPENLAYSYGTGIQIISPAGPIRLDYARRIPTDKIGFASRWHFTILYAF